MHSSALLTSLSAGVVKSAFTAVKNGIFGSFAMTAKGSEIAEGPGDESFVCIRRGGSKGLWWLSVELGCRIEAICRLFLSLQAPVAVAFVRFL